jgi:hypothetical protein
MAGYSDDARDEFNHAGGRRTIIFVSFRERTMSRDMSGRLAPIYDTLIEKPGTAGPSGLTIHAFRAGSGYLNEVLAVARTGDAAPFVARCLTGATAGLSLAPCERDVHVGGSLSMTFRFSDTLLGDWRRLEQAMRDYARRRIVGPSR